MLMLDENLRIEYLQKKNLPDLEKVSAENPDTFGHYIYSFQHIDDILTIIKNDRPEVCNNVIEL